MVSSYRLSAQITDEVLLSDMLRTVPTTLFFTLAFARTLRARVTPTADTVSHSLASVVRPEPEPHPVGNQAFFRKRSAGSNVSSVYTLFKYS